MKEKPYPFSCPFCKGDTVIRWGFDGDKRIETVCVSCGRRTGLLNSDTLIPVIKGQWTYEDAVDFHIDCAKHALEFMEKKRGDRNEKENKG